MNPGPLRSALYGCRVMHRRVSPKVHQFRYRMFLAAFDLDELDTLSARVRFFSRNRRNLYEFRDRDHLTLPGMEDRSVKENVMAWIAREGLPLPENVRITLLTMPRVLGYVFNPVSFYFCEDAAGTPLCAVVEVGNTFREMKPWLIREPSADGVFRLIAPKHFYVSPYSALDLCFDFRLKVPGESMEIHINDRAGDEVVLLSTLTGIREPFSAGRLLANTVKFPLVPLRVMFLIHWEALRLWMKRLPFHRKSENRKLQRGVYSPHRTLTGPPTP